MKYMRDLNTRETDYLRGMITAFEHAAKRSKQCADDNLASYFNRVKENYERVLERARMRNND